MTIIFDSEEQKKKVMNELLFELCPRSFGLENHCNGTGRLDDCRKCWENEVEMRFEESY